MSRQIDKYRNEKYKGRDFRLFKEWNLLDERFSNDSRVSEIIIRRQDAKSKLPEKYEIIFNIKSIIGVSPKNEKRLEEPIFGKQHKMTIELPESYPEPDGLPKFMFITDVWHPNIRFFGDFKGRVCLNPQDYPLTTPLIDFVYRIIDYLSYEDYFAGNAYPWPEDELVAAWVREQAEPNGWLNFTQD